LCVHEQRWFNSGVVVSHQVLIVFKFDSNAASCLAPAFVGFVPGVGLEGNPEVLACVLALRCQTPAKNGTDLDSPGNCFVPISVFCYSDVKLL
jgi:hypothetical protein